MRMGRTGIKKEDVYSAAQTLAEQGKVPTMHAVHAHIGAGSLTTIHKYLLQWKLERLLKPAIKIAPSKDAVTAKKIIEDNANLESIIKRQIEQNSEISYQLLAVEQENNKLKLEVASLLEELAIVKAQNSENLKLITEIKNHHNEVVNLLLHDKNSEIDSLKQELFTVHKASLELVRSTSFAGQDVLINERIKNINLHQKIKLLTDNIKNFAKTVMPPAGAAR
jgi:predicted RNase H-like nuclease (RuvC/YqgF family)